ncbi:DUF3263 domain-containing protein [Gordonia sp. OPL2]|jgi:hypothetical protein|uniref:DUF3263 domain-containing protein n=1 Tax=Gordonia sp. OPL2 TaxID=2486274 RepID=UPI0016566554|nr:DUF3263 domain-containing protein [Gordonia sp. OPL2]ROZ98277.1 DUF3263 domain-containing protein [Gordonia sp. OPL2]
MSASFRLRTVPAGPVDSAALVDYEVQWYRHGGGSDRDIADMFGLSAREYFGHLLGALETHAAHLPPTTVTGIRSVARRRLWLAS